ncbi:MAG: helix-turn-helix domain-containing protein, partial [Verrucomicrobiota bacterium]
TPLSLAGIWDVDADRSYRVRRKQADRNLIVFIRTLAGAGDVIYRDGIKRVRLEEGTLFCLAEKYICFYCTAETNWRFWWFLVDAGGSLPLPLEKKLWIPQSQEDFSDVQEVSTLIKQSQYEQRAQAMAHFTAMIYRWLSQWAGSFRRGFHEERIEQLIEQLHETPDKKWHVKRMATYCHLSERRFRDVFRQKTGQNPKRFLERLRLERGRELLRMGVCNVSETAARLGYSSTFHFSRAYRKMFNEPPSASVSKVDS